MLLYLFSLTALAVAPVLSQNCGPITSNTVVSPGADVTISSATSATLTNAGTVTVLSCGEASLGSSAHAVLSGGTATAIGGQDFNAYPSVTVPPSVTARIVSATAAYVTVQTGASLLVDNMQTDVYMTAQARATVDIKAGSGGNVEVTGVVSATGENMQFIGIGEGAMMFATGPGMFVGAFAAGATAIASGDSNVNVNAAAGGVGTMYGQSGSASFGDGGFMTQSGDYGFIYCANDGTGAVYGGYNTIELGDNCLLSVSGFNFVNTMGVGARVTLSALARATVPAGAAAYVQGGGPEATVLNGGDVTLEPGGTVLAVNEVTPTPARPNVRVFPVTQEGGYTYWLAQEVNSMRRRAQAPMPTARCAMNQSNCPNIHGGWSCVDVTDDIFNCGGCSLWSEISMRGVDCTTILDGDVKCVAGQCVA